MKTNFVKSVREKLSRSSLSQRPKEELFSIALFAAAVILVFLAVLKAGNFFIATARAENIIKIAAAEDADAEKTEKYLAEHKEKAEQLKKVNRFAFAPSKGHPVGGVLGILGDEALINGKWYKVGDKISDAEIVSIEPTRVKIIWEDKEKYFYPISAAGTPGPPKKPEKPTEEKKPPQKRQSDANKPEEKEKTIQQPAEDDPLAWLGVEISDALRAKLLEKWNSLSDDEKEKRKAEWNSLSDEQKKKHVERMEANIDKI